MEERPAGTFSASMGRGMAVCFWPLGFWKSGRSQRMMPRRSSSALVVEGDESAEDFFVGEIGRPAVGVGDGGVEIVVDLFEDGDEALLVDRLFFFVSGFGGAEFFQHVIHAGHRELGVLRLLAFAMGALRMNESGQRRS